MPTSYQVKTIHRSRYPIYGGYDWFKEKYNLHKKCGVLKWTLRVAEKRFTGATEDGFQVAGGVQ